MITTRMITTRMILAWMILRSRLSRGAAPVHHARALGASNPAATNPLRDSVTAGKSLPAESSRTQIDRYRVLKILGSGGFGTVYLAHDELLQRNVSIKLPHPRRVRGPAQLQQYMNEAMMVAQLDHPKIVPVYDVGILPEGICYVVSKYIDCETLVGRMKRRISPVEAIETTIDLAETLQHVHEAGIVHRDMKPANILVNRDGEHFINDFGLAMIEVSESDRGLLIGTPAYMSPEQASGEGHLVDGRSDIFSLGVILYEMLVGRRPFRGGSTEQILYQIRTIDHKPLRQLNRRLPLALERVCQKALSKQKGSRYSSAIEFAGDLRRVLEDWSDCESNVDPSSESRGPNSKSGVSSNSASGASWQATSGDGTRVVVIPKGLRAYDQHDAAFFKAMLPGPYDLDGCPESIRFWKNRINPSPSLRPGDRQRPETYRQEIEPFRIGVIYGTSGCGKSSFIRAGLIPMLDESVRVCIVDATSRGTLARLTQALARRVPRSDENADGDLSDDFSADVRSEDVLDSLADLDAPPDREVEVTVPIDRRMASIRRGENLHTGDKVLIVIDQFEQWLNSADAAERKLFIRAMRQCDGHRLQAILLVRDDFWLATSRLMRELDIALSAEHNLAMIDLLDKPHASKLLRMLGRAYGRIGEDGSRLGREQRQFIQDAVDGLASEGQVIAVQLALFAEMMKSRPWTRATLRSLGGIDRVVERFLQESFDAQTAPKNRRTHRDAAHKVLGAMLPETGLIRAGAIESSILARAAGYANNSEAMTDLIRVLDNQLKLITSVEPDSIETSEDANVSDVAHSEARYQLTHDSLIPAIRLWLAQHEGGSIKGRAKRDLKARSRAWAVGYDDRQLPSLFQWTRFAALVRRIDRSEDERSMMAAAARKHGRSILITMALLVAGTIGLRYIRNESRINSLVRQLAIATTDELPGILNQIEEDQYLAAPKLRERAKDGFEDDRVRFLAVMALPRDEELPPGVVASHLLSAGMDMVALSRNWRPDWIRRFEDDWVSTLRDPSAPKEERLRAGLFLAGLDSHSMDTREKDVLAVLDSHASFLVGAIVDESLSNKLAYAHLIELAKPMRKAWMPELISISWDTSQLSRRDAAIALIRDLNEGHPSELVDAALDLPRQEFLEILQATDIGSIPVQQIDEYLESIDSDQRQPERRAGRAIAMGAVMASRRTRSPAENFDWSRRITELTQDDRDGLGTPNLIHSLVPLDFDAERLFDSVFDNNKGTRCIQLFALGEFLQAQDDVNEGFRNRCRSVARERLHSDPDPGVFSAARWLLIRLGDQAWVEEELARRVEPVGTTGANLLVSRQLRVNVQKVPMVRFPACTIVASPHSIEHSSDPSWTEPLPYGIEVATEETTVEHYMEFDPAYSHASELKSQRAHIPVGVVPWEQAVAYCQWLTRREGMSESDLAYESRPDGSSTLRSDYQRRRGYRLPTAREWVAVWDADVARIASVKDDSLVAFYAQILPHSQGRPEPVGGVKPDRNGIFHLAGNAHEWCSDRQDDDHRDFQGIFYGWGLQERYSIAEPHWINGKINYVRIGFRVIRSIGKETNSDDAR